MKLHDIFTITTFLFGIINIFVILGTFMSFTWWTSIALEFVWVVWVFNYADKRAIYEHCGGKFVTEEVFGLKQ